MTEESVVVVAGARTAIGSYGGSFKATPASTLGAVAVREALVRSGVESSEVGEVVLGCVGQVGPDAFHARRVSLEAGLPVSTTAYNVNRLCGSGLQALWNGVLELRYGSSQVVVAGGAENMTMQPFLDYQGRTGYRLGHRRVLDGTLSLVTDPWGDYPMGETAEVVAERFSVAREEQDRFALRSQQRAARAITSGLFDAEIVGVNVLDGRSERMFDRDEHPRPDITLERLAGLKPTFREGGTVTPGNSSGINDAGAALVLTRESTARQRNLGTMGRFAAFSKAAVEPEIMGYAPTFAIQQVLSVAGLKLEEVGVIELNEAFAAQAVAVIRDTGMDEDIVNPNGGAIALGHPIGATGAILALKLLHEMRRRDVEWGLVSMCIGGGQAVAGLFQAVG